MNNAFYLLWIIGCFTWCVVNVLFWRIAYSLCVKFGMQDNEGNGTPFIFAALLSTAMIAATLFAPFNNWYIP